MQNCTFFSCNSPVYYFFNIFGTFFFGTPIAPKKFEKLFSFSTSKVQKSKNLYIFYFFKFFKYSITELKKIRKIVI